MAMPVELQPGQTSRPPRVRFETRAEEDRDASLKAGHPMFKDVDIAIVTPLGSYAEVEAVAEEWVKRQVREPYHDSLVRAYEAFKQGKEPPLEGTPIEACTLLTPAEIKTIKTAQCRTVEDLAAWPDGNLGMFGMGAVRFKQRAKAWLDSANSTGAAAAKIEAQAVKIETLESTNAGLQEQLAGLASRLAVLEGPRPKLGLKKSEAAE